MYALASHLNTLPVISLQTGETVAVVTGLIVNPDNLRLMGFTIIPASGKTRTLLVLSAVRQLALDCVIVDNDDELSEPGDIVRLAELLRQPYNPLGKPVVTDLGRKLGSVEDYTVNLETELLQKIYVRPPLSRAWYQSSLIIDRAQIIDVQRDRFIVRDNHNYATTMAAETASAKAS
jgi:sporulation protein YlmC with PRC-barrel domain